MSIKSVPFNVTNENDVTKINEDNDPKMKKTNDRKFFADLIDKFYTKITQRSS